MKLLVQLTNLILLLKPCAARMTKTAAFKTDQSFRLVEADNNRSMQLIRPALLLAVAGVGHETGKKEHI